MSGFLALDGGRIRLGGVDVDRWPAHLRSAAGLGRTFQEARLFSSLTVAETIAVAQERHLRSRDMIAAGLRLPASLDSEADVKATHRRAGARGWPVDQDVTPATISAKAAGAVTGRRWPESTRMTVTGSGSRRAITSWVAAGTGRSCSLST